MYVIAALLLAGILVACTTPANLRARNRGRINQLSIGLVRDDVLSDRDAEGGRGHRR